MSLGVSSGRHMQALLSSLGRLARSPLATFLTLLVIGLALATFNWAMAHDTVGVVRDKLASPVRQLQADAAALDARITAAAKSRAELPQFKLTTAAMVTAARGAVAAAEMARANALEDNVTIYHTVNGQRTEKKRANMNVATNQWHTIRVEFQGTHFVVRLDGKDALAWDDDTFKDAGNVGVWTKADSVTLFDDFSYSSK